MYWLWWQTGKPICLQLNFIELKTILTQMSISTFRDIGGTWTDDVKILVLAVILLYNIAKIERGRSKNTWESFSVTYTNCVFLCNYMKKKIQLNIRHQQPRCPSKGEWINKLVIHTMAYHLVIKRNELSNHKKARRNLKCILLNGGEKPIWRGYTLYDFN